MLAIASRSASSRVASSLMITEGEISHGTLRTADLLRTFGDTLESLNPTLAGLAAEARDYAEAIEAEESDGLMFTDTEAEAADCLDQLISELDEVAAESGLYFGASEGDGASFGFWRAEEEAEPAEAEEEAEAEPATEGATLGAWTFPDMAEEEAEAEAEEEAEPAGIVTAEAPSHWAAYLINGDSSGLAREEEAAADAWIRRLGLGLPVTCRDAGFVWRHDAERESAGGADCQTFVFLT